ncbi:MAG: ribonuclease Z [Bacteroidales bacterium]|nr:ribonuclease Z [Bacteroidales bacterium]
MNFKLTVLGSSSALPTSTKYPAAHVLNVHERFFLIDCGEGTQMQLRKARIRFGRINHIFISHMHGDHVFGLPGFLSTLNLLGRKTPLFIYGPPGLKVIIDFYLQHFAADNDYPIILKGLTDKLYHKIYEDKVLEVFAFPLKHRIPTYGYHFCEKERPLNMRKDRVQAFNLSIKQILAAKAGEDVQTDDGAIIPNARLTEPPYKRRSFAYCSDTAYYRKNAEFLKETDLLYHEATFSEKDKELAKETGHSTAAQAAKFATQANVGQLLIGHFSNRYNDPTELLHEARAVFPDTMMAEELSDYPVKLIRKLS